MSWVITAAAGFPRVISATVLSGLVYMYSDEISLFLRKKKRPIAALFLGVSLIAVGIILTSNSTSAAEKTLYILGTGFFIGALAALVNTVVPFLEMTSYELLYGYGYGYESKADFIYRAEMLLSNYSDAVDAAKAAANSAGSPYISSAAHLQANTWLATISAWIPFLDGFALEVPKWRSSSILRRYNGLTAGKRLQASHDLYTDLKKEDWVNILYSQNPSHVDTIMWYRGMNRAPDSSDSSSDTGSTPALHHGSPALHHGSPALNHGSSGSESEYHEATEGSESD